MTDYPKRDPRIELSYVATGTRKPVKACAPAGLLFIGILLLHYIGGNNPVVKDAGKGALEVIGCALFGFLCLYLGCLLILRRHEQQN